MTTAELFNLWICVNGEWITRQSGTRARMVLAAQRLQREADRNGVNGLAFVALPDGTGPARDLEESR